MGNWIKTTTDYSRFKWLKGNRVINAKKVGELIRSISEHGYRGVPIVVNNNMEVIDGQHRLMALKHLKRPVPYIVDDNAGLRECVALNSVSTRWKNSDYIHAQVEQGNESYVILSNLLEKHKPFSVSTVAFALNRRSYSRMAMNSGQFVILDKSEEHIRQVEDDLDLLARLTQGRKARGSRFDMAVLFALGVSGIDRNRLERQVAQMLQSCLPYGTIQAWLMAIRKAYNKGTSRIKWIYLDQEYDKYLACRGERVSETLKARKKKKALH